MNRVKTYREARRVRVKYKGEIIADTQDAVRLEEGSYPPVFYVPRRDVDMARLVRSGHKTHCPYKGDASYYSFAGGPVNAIWTYETPMEAVKDIRGHLAFYPDKVDAIEVVDESSRA